MIKGNYYEDIIKSFEFTHLFVIIVIGSHNKKYVSFYKWASNNTIMKIRKRNVAA